MEELQATALTMSDEIGELSETRGELSTEWRITNIWELTKGEHCSYASPVFPFHDSCWRLGFTIHKVPEGLSGYVAIYISLYLRREDWGPSTIVHSTLVLRNEDGPEEILHKGSWKAFLKNGIIETNYVKLTSGTLTVFCTMKSEDKQPIGVSLFGRLWNVSLSMRDILTGRKSSDMLKLKNGETRAHRMILESRFPDFVRKLDKEMKENQTGEINADDGDDEAFDIVLSYVYSGDLEGLSAKNVWAVYRIAFKYNLQKLKELCTMFLEKDLSVAGVCDVISMATQYKEAELKKHAIDFFAKNCSDILQTDKWKSFSKEYPSLLPELIECMTQEMCNISTELIKLKLQASEMKKL